MMKVNKWTLGLAAVGLVTLPATMQAEEKMSALNTALASTTISGYVDVGAHWWLGKQITPAINGAPPAYAFNGGSKQDGFNLNAVNLVIEKPLDAADSWAAGYKIDMIYGPNAVGWNNSPGSTSSELALKQAYVALRAPVGNGIDFKLGTWDTIIGYEVFHAGNNPNYTRSWGYTFEPTQHTGLLASYQFCKEIGIAFGVANTVNSGINNRSFLTSARSETDKTYMGAITLTAPDSWGFLAGSTVYGGIVSGFNNGLPFGVQDHTINLYAGATLNTPVKGLKLGLAYDHVGNEQGLGSTIPGFINKANLNAASLYLSYQATEKLSFHGRTEYVWTDLPKGIFGGGFAKDMFAVTATVQYDLWANVLSRVEFRWDHALDGTRPFGISDRNSLLLAANIIYKF